MSTGTGKAVDTARPECYKSEALEVSEGDSNVNSNKSFSFADGYGLGLIAKDPGGDWSGIVEHLSDPAQRIAKDMITSVATQRDVKGAAGQLLAIAKKIKDDDRR